ncbi:outer membrane beta-barrel family protein [Pontibacter fetidus]|uniref:TonB-dependent receptor n=1 Tax=Pontibacter fetidus TaxID=2700082 RepID=A0A6B2H2J7_9BACT|nr:outer membrane beta-barrel family protein [Pontibacter fetidus]NDK56601.1 TonB-dependent receptor [Pontibacter fetidus]
MKKNVLLLLLGLSTAPVFAQTQQGRPMQQQAAPIPGTTAPKGNAKISGVVLDADTKAPVEFATVALVNAATGKPIDGTMADEKGRFTINKVATGKYKLLVSFIGYQQKTLNEFTISSDSEDLNMGSITLASNAQKLNEVVVTGEKPLVEEKIDRTVYNAEKDITNAGGNAADVLQKVPSLSLDNDGNVQLRGSSNVRVLINNKPSAIMAGSIADALKQIPADQIKSVEVITSPSAKYDAEGTAGIINIITKKDGGLQGVTGSVAVGVGTRGSNANASLNVRRGKLGINGTFGGNMFYNKGDLTNTMIFYDNPETLDFDESSYSFQSGNTRINGAFMNGQLGFEYDLTPQNNISGSIRSNGGLFRMQNDQNVFSETSTAEREFDNKIRNRNQRMSTDYNLDYTHYFKKPQQELAILSQLSVTDVDSKIDQDYSTNGEAPYSLVRNTNNSLNEELTFQVDYTHPFNNKTLLEIGAKNIMRDVTSDAKYNETPTPAQPRPDDAFFYQQDVYATYLTYGFALKKKLNVKLGGRYEYTDVAADLNGTERDYTTDYDNFIPSIALSYSIKNVHTFKANFTQRIQRPSMNFLNPYLQKQTSNTYVQGNPNIDAELTNLYEIGYSTFFKTTSINVTGYMRQTDNAIETVASPYTTGDGQPATLLTFQNIATNKTYGVSLFGNTKPTSNWTIGGSSNIYFVDLNSKYNSNSGWMYNINANSSYTFGKGISAQFNGGFNSRRVQLLGKFNSFSFHQIAIKKELFDKKGGVSIGLDNPFRKSMKMENDVVASATPVNPASYEQHIRINNYNRGVRVSFDYRFGKMDQQRPPKRKKSIRNDDAKQGDGGGVQ